MLIGPGTEREFAKKSFSSSLRYTLNVFIKYVLNVGNISFKMYNCLFLYRFIFLRYILVARYSGI